MPNKESAKKRVRQNERRRIRNRATRSDFRTAVKKIIKNIEAKSVETLDSDVKVAQSKLAKAAKRNIVKKNTLARTTSRLMKAINKAKAVAKA